MSVGSSYTSSFNEFKNQEKSIGFLNGQEVISSKLIQMLSNFYENSSLCPDICASLSYVILHKNSGVKYLVKCVF
jgi:hypothetical protein